MPDDHHEGHEHHDAKPPAGQPDAGKAGPHQHEGEPDHAQGHSNEHHDKHSGHTPEMFRDRFFVALMLTLPILYYADLLQLWLGYEAAVFPGSKWISPVLATVIYLYGGLVFIRGAVDELKNRTPGMMTLISLAITVAFLYSVAVTLGFPGMDLYWELATLVTIMLLGHWMEMASVQKAGKALEHLVALVPSTAHKFVGERVVDVPVDELEPGDGILIRPGEQVPADGLVTDGASAVNEAFLTGESMPVPKVNGDEVIAGSVNGEGALTVEVTRTGDETTLSQIHRLVKESQASRSRFQNLADRAAGWLTYTALAAGALTFSGWSLFSPETLDFALTRTVVVLVIACPHALGLAIPLVTVNATTLAARSGILVRNREAFERARDIRTVAFDKTGTLTEGEFGVREIYTAENTPVDSMLALAAALEARSEHHLARAVVTAAEDNGLSLPAVDQFTAEAGKGISGIIDGRRYRLGRPEWFEEHGLELPANLESSLCKAEERGESVVALFDDAEILALISLADRVRERARDAVARLLSLDIDVVMITGDGEAVARVVSEELGIQRYHARVLPADKASLVAELQDAGPVAFVGDGINDGPALLEANLGVAIGAGTNVAIESADLVLVENDPMDVVGALRLSRATFRKMIQNLLWATGYNVVAIPLAAGVAASWGILLSPAVGAVFMSLSTVIVAVNAMLLRSL